MGWGEIELENAPSSPSGLVILGGTLFSLADDQLMKFSVSLLCAFLCVLVRNPGGIFPHLSHNDTPHIYYEPMFSKIRVLHLTLVRQGLTVLVLCRILH